MMPIDRVLGNTALIAVGFSLKYSRLNHFRTASLVSLYNMGPFTTTGYPFGGS
jgi:hypothetical protein